MRTFIGKRTVLSRTRSQILVNQSFEPVSHLWRSGSACDACVGVAEGSAFDSLFRFIHWCLGAPARGKYPTQRHDGLEKRRRAAPSTRKEQDTFQRHALVHQGKLNTSPRLGSIHEVRAHTDHERKRLFSVAVKSRHQFFRQRQISKAFGVVTTRRRRTENEYSAALAQFPSRISAIMKFAAGAVEHPVANVDRWNTDPRTATPLMMLRRNAHNELDDTRTMERRSTQWMRSRDTGTHGRPTRRSSSAEFVCAVSFRRAKRPLKWSGAHSGTRRRAHRPCMGFETAGGVTSERNTTFKHPRRLPART